MSALHIQQMGRALRGRIAHAQRARKLRRRGEDVRPVRERTDTDRVVYRWYRQPPIIDHQ